MRVVLFAVLVAFGAGVVAQETGTTDGSAAQSVFAPATPPQPKQPPIPPLAYSGPLPTFEVTSVRKSPQDARDRLPTLTVRGDRFVVENYSLREVIRMVFNARDYQLVGGPEWLTTDRFLIMGKATAEASRDQLYLMMRSLLGERFGLTSHIEQRLMSVYALERSARDAALGGGITPLDCSNGTPALTNQMLFDAKRRGMVPCGLDYMAHDGIVVGGITMGRLAGMLGSMIEDIVVDRTGLTGTYSVRLDFGGLGSGVPPEGSSQRPSDPSSVFTAVRNQGLQLSRRSESVEVLVIDSVQQPTEN